MSTYNLILEYRKKQHGNVDVLSRPPEIDISGRWGCVCVIALANIWRCIALQSSDGQPDFESRPSIPPVEITMISLVTRSRRNTQPKVKENDPQADKSQAVPSQRRRGELRTGEALPPVLQSCQLGQNEDEIRLVENLPPIRQQEWHGVKVADKEISSAD
jgi:hypothetical protein